MSPQIPRAVSPTPQTLDLSPSKLNDRYGETASPEPPKSAEPQLGPSKLNERYNRSPVANGHIPNGGIPNGNTSPLELSANKINQRYMRNQPTSPPLYASRIAAKDQIIRRQRSESGRFAGDRSDRMSNKSSNPTDMDQWLDRVFDPILHTNIDEISDARTLESRLKGGGKGITGLATQVSCVLCLSKTPTIIRDPI